MTGAPSGINGRGDIVFAPGLKLDLHESAMASPTVIGLCLKGWNELFAKGLSDGRLELHAGLSAIVGVAANGRDELAVGVMLYSIEPALKRMWVTLSYVEPEFRGRGIYRALWNALVAEAGTREIDVIEGATHVRNTGMRAVAQRLGRAEEFVIMVTRLK